MIHETPGEADAETREAAARQLQQAVDGRRAVLECRKLLAHADPGVRAAAVLALERSHPAGESSTPEVYGLLADPDRSVRHAAAGWFARTSKGHVLGLHARLAADESLIEPMGWVVNEAPVAWAAPAGGDATASAGGPPGAVMSVGTRLRTLAGWGLLLQWPLFAAFALALAARVAPAVAAKAAPHPGPLP